jgi:hypothetical protein
VESLTSDSGGCCRTFALTCDGAFLGYLLAPTITAPEPNSSRLEQVVRFGAPHVFRGPWPTSLGCTEPYSSINPISANASERHASSSPLPAFLSC